MRCCRQTLGFLFFTKQWLHITEYNSAQCTSGRLCKPSHVWKLMEHWLGKRGYTVKLASSDAPSASVIGPISNFTNDGNKTMPIFLLCQNKIAQRWYRMEWEVSRLRVMKKEVVKFAGEKAIQVRSFFSFYEQHHGWLGKIQNVPLGDLMGIQTWHDLSKSVVGPSGTLCSVVSVVIQ